MRIFKIFRKNEDQDVKFGSSSQYTVIKALSSQKSRFNIMSNKSSSQAEEQTKFTLKEVLSKCRLNRKFLKDKVFELDILQNNENQPHEGPEFKFVHLKVTKVNSEKLMIQIIDISDKMLYNEVRAEQSFFTLMNAAVSHELRNPLASLIGGIEAMKDFLENVS